MREVTKIGDLVDFNWWKNLPKEMGKTKAKCKCGLWLVAYKETKKYVQCSCSLYDPLEEKAKEQKARILEVDEQKKRDRKEKSAIKVGKLFA